MIIKGQTDYKYHIKKALNKMQNVNKWQSDFILEIYLLFLSIKGRMNFLQLGRFSKHSEQRFRNQFENSFDHLSFNKALVLENGSGHYTIAFDPSYIGKSGKSTPGVGWYWSGVAGKSKWGLEISGIAAIDIDNHTGFHLEAVQTPNTLAKGELLQHYSNIIIERKEQLLQISKYVVADAYFSKEPFVSAINNNGFEVVSRLRTDAYLQYLFTGKQKKGRGRPRKYTGKIDYNNLDLNYFNLVHESEKSKVLQAKVYSKSLKRMINLVIVFSKSKGKWTYKLYFSTDLNLKTVLLLDYYKSRFQIEFIYRDAKQFTGLHDCQARSQNKLDFHFNIALSTVNIAKITHWLSIPKAQRMAFSMSDIKTMYHNELLLNRFISVFGIPANKLKNNNRIRELITYGTIAA
jgi:hypothetical protein